MHKKRMTHSSMIIMLMSTGLVVSGCSNSKSANDFVYSETPSSKIDRGMDNQPESSYWFPEDFLAWDVTKDPDAKYNVSNIPLAKRVDKKELTPSNDIQDKQTKVVALSIMNSSTSGNSPFGINTFDANVFSYWQYIDQLVYWGGSSGEGIIVPPSPDVIDASHKNGVPILGTIFFPQTEHGGKIEWLDEFLQKDNKGHFPAVDKMIEVAETYGFDGWFINQETDNLVTSFDDVKDGKETEKTTEDGLTKEHATLMMELIKEFKETAPETLDIMWYDSMTSEGKMDWQNALTDENKSYLVDGQMNPLSDSMFLNFWWNTEKFAKDDLLKESNIKAQKEGIDPYSLYAGIDVQENGYSTPVKWDLFMNEKGKPYTSLGLYVPSWTYASTDNPDDFQMKENIFWVNSQSDPRQATLPKEGEWPGISTFSIEQTAITSVPFKTNFNLGNGYNYFIDGEKVSSRNWNNRSLQDIMPTYRWEIDYGKGNDGSMSIDYADAYNGGNSLKYRGNMKKNATNTIHLYRTDMTIDKNTVISTTAKANEETELNLVATLKGGKKQVLSPNGAIKEDWTKVTYDTDKLVGKTITDISYEWKTTSDAPDYEFKLGELAMLPKEEKSVMDVKKLTIEDAIFDEEESNFAGVRLTWESDKTDGLSHYDIYQVNDDKSRSFIGATLSTTHYINALERVGESNKTTLEVVPVDVFGKRGKQTETIVLEWPDNSLPKADFTASQTLVAPGKEVTFTNQSTDNADEFIWEFEGGDIKSSTKENPVVTFDKEGSYKVKLTAKNKSGESVMEQEKFIVVSEEIKDELEKLSTKDSQVEASSFINDGEAPQFVLDGNLETKWCAVGSAPHDITIDLGAVKTVSQVNMFHAEAGGESPDMNSKAYKIEVSEDGKEFKQVKRVISNASAETTDTFAPVKAQYVRITLDKPSQGADSAARIYGIDIFGM